VISYLEVVDPILEDEENLMRELPGRFIEPVVHQAAGNTTDGSDRGYREIKA
jgi:hypothetical protein